MHSCALRLLPQLLCYVVTQKLVVFVEVGVSPEAAQRLQIMLDGLVKGLALALQPRLILCLLGCLFLGRTLLDWQQSTIDILLLVVLIVKLVDRFQKLFAKLPLLGIVPVYDV